MDSMRKRRVQPEEGNQTQSRMWLFRLLHLHMTREKFWILSPSNKPLLPVCVWQSQVISRCNQTDLRSFILFRFRNFCHFFSQLLVNFLTIDELIDQIIVAAPRMRRWSLLSVVWQVRSSCVDVLKKASQFYITDQRFLTEPTDCRL